MRGFIFIGLSLLLGINNIVANDYNADSLVNLLTTRSLSPKEQLHLYKRICSIYTDNDNDKLIQYTLEGIQLSQKEKDIALESEFYENLGVAYEISQSYDTAFVYFEKALQLAVSINDIEQIASVNSSMGGLYRQQQQYHTAIEYYLKGVTVCENTEHKRIYTRLLINIGGVYRILDNTDRAIYYLEQAKTIADKENDLYGQMNIYYNLGAIYLQQEKYTQALGYVQKTYDISLTYQDKKYEISSLHLLTSISLQQGDYSNAEKYADKCLQVTLQHDDTRLLIKIYNVVATVYLAQKRYHDCLDLSFKALDIDSTDLIYSTETLYNIILSFIYLMDQEKAAEFLLKYRNIHQEYNKKKFYDTISELEIKYETEKKEIRIASLEKERLLYIWLSITGTLLALTFAILLWQTNKNRQKEKQLVAANALREGERAERERIAGELHDRLLGTLSTIKPRLNDTGLISIVDRCIEEVRRVIHNLMPASLRYGLKPALQDFTMQFPNVCFHFFGREKRIGKGMEFVIYCCANELVTNSIRHSGAKEINVQLIQGDDYVSLIIQDDGCGFDEKSVRQGLGLKNLRDRVASCNGKIDIISSPGQGTETIIEIQNEKN